MAVCTNVVTEFAVPTANSGVTNIWAGPRGNLWFVEIFSNKIGQLTTGGVFNEFEIPTLDNQLQGIGPGPDGQRMVHKFSEQDWTHHAERRVPRIRDTDTNVQPLPVIVVGPDGNLWFTDSAGTKIAEHYAERRVREGVHGPYIRERASRPHRGAGRKPVVYRNRRQQIARVTTNGEFEEAQFPLRRVRRRTSPPDPMETCGLPRTSATRLVGSPQAARSPSS